jgi:hypothetical protein
VTPARLVSGSDFSLFKTGVEPKWEDQANQLGGKWTYLVSKSSMKQQMDTQWLNLVRSSPSLLLCAGGWVLCLASSLDISGCGGGSVPPGMPPVLSAPSQVVGWAGLGTHSGSNPNLAQGVGRAEGPSQRIESPTGANRRRKR